MVTQANTAIARELARIRWGRPRRPLHPGYAAIVTRAYQLSLPKRAASDITVLDRRLLVQRRPRQFAWLLHESGSLLSIPEPNERPLDLHAARRLFGQALPFWWDGVTLIRAERIDELIDRMAATCVELRQKASELL